MSFVILFATQRYLKIFSKGLSLRVYFGFRLFKLIFSARLCYGISFYFICEFLKPKRSRQSTQTQIIAHLPAGSYSAFFPHSQNTAGIFTSKAA